MEKPKIVGTTTFGKGVIQKLMQLIDGSGLKITSEEYLTPNRTKIKQNRYRTRRKSRITWNSNKCIKM